jgi:putative ABC transport system substrate-binding protein
MRRRAFIVGLGSAAAWPVVARAQRPMPTIGFMSGRSSMDSAHLVAAFRQGLGKAGFVEGQNVLIEFRWANGQYDRLPEFAAELVELPVAVLAGVGGDPSALAAKKATSTIPVVFGMGSDPIKAGLVESFNRPVGNVTGYTLWTNQLESSVGLLRELVPNAPLFGVLLNPKFPPATLQLHDIEGAARSVNQKLFVINASNDEELTAALASFAEQRVSAVLIAADPYFDTQRERLITFSLKNRLPMIYQFREFAVSGGLISYGPSITDGYFQGGSYVGRILRGEKPGDLPVLQPNKFELVINLKAANALGLTLPNSIQLLADEVIE